MITEIQQKKKSKEARIENNYLTTAEQLERQSQEYLKEIELAKFHEERGKKGCDCWSFDSDSGICKKCSNSEGTLLAGTFIFFLVCKFMAMRGLVMAVFKLFAQLIGIYRLLLILLAYIVFKLKISYMPHTSYEKLLQELSQLKAELETIKEGGGIKIIFPEKTTAKQIIRRVNPRILKELPRYSFNPTNSSNFILEGDNLHALSSLYQYRNKVDLIITDPPYNTGKDFRYNDKWNEDPNDEGIGNLIKSDDPSRHTK
ncbi:8700_t:CDS:2 [Diversispora eburnea]|uniref:8700_t:CDS:1 n=1 Tax=Diversispora eburnea TaxID=1213867 RepID=A0A9N9C6A9_9GLOM|nr:8700_t:CDS:2 [Diversispora eburnea]